MIDNNYIVIQGWMINQLNLKGNELLCYALIYGFSQDGKSEFIGSASYIAGWLNIDKRRVFDVLKRLTEKGYIQKSEKFVANNVKLCSYRAVKNVTASDEMSSPSDEMSSNNIVNNIVNNTKQVVSKDTTSNSSNTKNNFTETKNYSAKINTTKDKSVSENEFDFGIQTKTRKPNMYDKCLAIIDDYTNDSELRKLLIQYLNLRLEMSDKPLKYANQWKGLLNLLSRLSNSIDDQKQIVNQSIIKGWGTFVEIKDYNRKGFNENIHHTEPEHKARKDMTDEEWYESRAKNPDGSLRVY